MPKAISSYELTLDSRPHNQTLTSWLYAELRAAILHGRLAPGTRLPASRDFAAQHGFSRGTVVSVFERLQAEGYVSCQVGLGTWVNRLATVHGQVSHQETPPAYVRRVLATYARPRAWIDLAPIERGRPFQAGDPAIEEFPARLWGSIAAKRARSFSSWL